MNMACHHLWYITVTISIEDEYSEKFLVASGSPSVGYHTINKEFNKCLKGKHDYSNKLKAMVQRLYPDKQVKTFHWFCNDWPVINGVEGSS